MFMELACERKGLTLQYMRDQKRSTVVITCEASI